MSKIIKLFSCIFLFIFNFAYAEELTLNEVINSVNEKFPLLLGLEQEIIRAQGEQTTALGEFDLKWKSKLNNSTLGFYRNQSVISVLEKPTALWGMNIYGGYREGSGNFPVYEGKYETTRSGELHAGIQLPLLRDREIDQRRAALKSAELGIDLADNFVAQKKIEMIFKATEKYWSWVAYGLREHISNELLKTAKDRIDGLKQRVSLGDVPDIELKDNQRAVLQREAQLIKAERAFQNGSIELSLYYRDNEASPIIPILNEVPKRIQAPSRTVWNREELIKTALKNRPEIKALNVEKSQIEVDNKLNENQLTPKLDLFMEVSDDMGRGDRTKEQAELETGILIDIPLQRRKAEGKITSNTAKLNKIQRQLEFFSNRIKADVQDAISALENAQSQVEIIREELKLAREVEKGERERFSAGESTILIVNLRELATADTAAKEVEALAEYRVAEAMLKAAIGEL